MQLDKLAESLRDAAFPCRERPVSQSDAFNALKDGINGSKVKKPKYAARFRPDHARILP